jgi:hypothetical protein
MKKIEVALFILEWPVIQVDHWTFSFGILYVILSPWINLAEDINGALFLELSF